MLRIHTLLAAGLFLFAGRNAAANDFEGLASALKQVWPDKPNLAVVCNYTDETSRAQVQELAAALGGSHRVTVFHTTNASQTDHVATLVQMRRTNTLVLVPGDPVFGDGNAQATRLISRMTFHRIPTVATTQAALAQGAFFAVGPQTNGELMVNDQKRGIWEVILPDKAIIIRNQTGADIEVIEVP